MLTVDIVIDATVLLYHIDPERSVLYCSFTHSIHSQPQQRHF